MGKVKYNEEMKLQTVKYVLEGGKSASKVTERSARTVKYGLLKRSDESLLITVKFTAVEKSRKPLRQMVFSSANGRFEELCERTDSIPKCGRNGSRTERQKVMVCIAKTRSNATFCPIDLMNSGQEILPISPPTWGGFILLPSWI